MAKKNEKVEFEEFDMSEEWEEVERNFEEGKFWIPEHDLEEIVGIFKGFEEGTYGKNGILELPDGAEKYLPANVLLNQRLENVEPGSKVKIVYLGYIKLPNGRRAKDYKVYVAKRKKE